MWKKTYTWACRLVLAAGAIYCVVAYFELRASSDSLSKRISYMFVSKVLNPGRGHHTDVNIRYKDSVYAVGLHYSNYDKIDKGILPDLYYSARKDYVFDKDAELRTRPWGVVLFLANLIITFLPLEAWERKLRE
jgi:hypothetical protein